MQNAPAASGNTDPNTLFVKKIFELYHAGIPVKSIVQELIKETRKENGLIDLGESRLGRRSIHPWDMLGHAYRQEGKYGEAEYIFRMLIEEMEYALRDGKKVLLGLAYNDLGVVLLERGYLGGAYRAFENALRWDVSQGINRRDSFAAKNLDSVTRALLDRERRREALVTAGMRRSFSPPTRDKVLAESGYVTPDVTKKPKMEVTSTPAGSDKADMVKTKAAVPEVIDISTSPQEDNLHAQMGRGFLKLCTRGWHFGVIGTSALIISQTLLRRLSLGLFIASGVLVIVVAALPRLVTIKWKDLAMSFSPMYERVTALRRGSDFAESGDEEPMKR